MNTAKHYINGRWLESVEGQAKIGMVLNPATSEHVVNFCDGTASEAGAAVTAARAAFEDSSWAHSPRIRADVLFDFAIRLEQRKDEIADLIVTVNGKLRREAMGEIMAGVSELKYYAGLARNLFGRTLEVEPDCYASLDREPSGVAAIILPWNAPVTLLVRSLAPALAAGCSVVIKPAHQTALVNNLVLECITDDARVPAGIINSVIESGTAVSSFLCESTDVDVISFTGSTRVGKLIAQSTASTLKRLSLELGGKAPAVVFADCNIDATVAGVVAGSMVMAGQQCTAIARVLVEAAIYDEFSQRLTQALKNLQPGFGNDPQAGMGCLIDIANRDRIAALLEQAAQTERVLLKGEIPGGALANGAFIAPSLIEVQDLNSSFIQQELFGPLLIIERFTDEAEALHRSNATRYSLAASVWTQNAGRAKKMAAKLKFGTVWHNTHNRLFAEAETGGYGDSGYGKLHGLEGMNDFMQTKHFYFETR
ncbi:aldehyde dehydrogenase family protein [Pusillimonas sp. CC-YST705]|uniref:Aldehyde dehydrogenase family protein n=1 Tax=Mesopusillimonas faecipullorum TaxID=2755040 RepID=A0ABS8CBM2_9BURK|nr:aldehyde dehydrogenase family protein [Mesopusillimonas faecipullorum]MCB5363425.1 aldehyde dehydrogenase family protein [Mesopusillimonas faecipullorum]